MMTVEETATPTVAKAPAVAKPPTGPRTPVARPPSATRPATPPKPAGPSAPHPDLVREVEAVFGALAALGPPPAEPPRPPAPAAPPEAQAATARRGMVPSLMAAFLGLGQVGALGFRAYLDGLLARAADPGDPVEAMLLEQVAMCHLHAANLQNRAAHADGLAEFELCAGAVVRLRAEVRRTAETLAHYRASEAKRRGRDRGGRRAKTAKAATPSDDEMGSNEGGHR